MGRQHPVPVYHLEAGAAPAQNAGQKCCGGAERKANQLPGTLDSATDDFEAMKM
jgi:hypothetical protein